MQLSSPRPDLSGAAPPTEAIDRRDVGEALLRSEQRYASLVRALPGFVYAASPDGSREYIGPGFYNFTGLTPGTADGDGWLGAVHPVDRPRVREHFRDCLSEKCSCSDRYRCRAADGTYHWFLDRCAPSLDGDGKVVEFYGICTAEQDQKLLQDEVPQSHVEWDGHVPGRESPVGSVEADLDRQLTGRPRSEENLRITEADGRKILGALVDLYCWLEPDGTIRRYHAGTSTFFPPEAVMGRRIQELLSPPVARQIAEALEHVSRGADPVEMEFRQFVGEEERWYSARILPLAIESLLFVVRDVTKGKRAEEGFRQVVEWAPIGMLLVDRDGAINLVNSRVERQFGYRRDELIGLPVEVLLPQRYRDGHPTQRRTYFANPSARAMRSRRDLTGLRKDGTEFPLEIGLNPIPGKQGGFVLASIIDITERKGAEAELGARAEELARSNAELQQFAYVASHDLQEPLRMVASYLGLLAKRYRGRLDERADKFIDYAVDGASRMQTLIDDLLAYSRVVSKATPFETTDCGEVFRAAISNLGTRITETEAIVTSDRLPTLNADPVQLLQLLQNLIGNALKFCETRPRVHVGAERRGGEWRFTVRDNGIGIAPEHFERIFQIFQRLHTRANYSGTGIGLAICKKVVERHGGRIAVAPAAGGGSEFSFTIPSKGRESRDLRDSPADR